MKIEFKNVSKTFGRGKNQKVAVDDVSWQSEGGEIFGLLGPNGAGKTTMIRMMLDIVRPDSGEVLLNGARDGNRTLDFKRRIGYLPEERGLYQKRKVLDVMLYFAALKGIARGKAKKKALEMLERFELANCASKKIQDLSKGMGQKVQIASCFLHDPDLVVLDEPFSGLDPVNTRLIRDTILELKQQGKMIFLSTHMMSEVEALCDRIFMINQGKQVLYGGLDEIRRSYTTYEVLMDHEAQTEGLQSIASIDLSSQGQCIHLKPENTIHDLMNELAKEKRAFSRLEEARMPVEDIFVQVVGKSNTAPTQSQQEEVQS